MHRSLYGLSARVILLCVSSSVFLATTCPTDIDVKALRVVVEGDGEVTPCCAGIYRTGTVVRLEAKPAPGWVLKSWRGNAGVGMSTGLILDVLMDRDKEIIATFDVRPINEDDLKSADR